MEFSVLLLRIGTDAFLLIATTVKTEPGVEPEVTVKEEEKEEKKEKDIVKKEEKEKERERSTRSGVIKEEKEKPGSSSSQPEESVGERLSVVGGSKRKEMEQLKIVRVELK